MKNRQRKSKESRVTIYKKCVTSRDAWNCRFVAAILNTQRAPTQRAEVSIDEIPRLLNIEIKKSNKSDENRFMGELNSSISIVPVFHIIFEFDEKKEFFLVCATDEHSTLGFFKDGISLWRALPLPHDNRWRSTVDRNGEVWSNSPYNAIICELMQESSSEQSEWDSLDC